MESKPQSSCPPRKSARQGNLSPNSMSCTITYIDEMELFMHHFVDKIVDIVGEGSCGCRVIVALLG